MDLLVKSLAGIGDDSSLARLAGSFNDRAEMLTREGSADAAAWASVFTVLALTAESALLQRRTGIAV